jgi:hypothetical protein
MTVYGHSELFDREGGKKTGYDRHDYSIMTAKIECKGLCGGNASHGAYAKVRLEDHASTAWAVRVENSVCGPGLGAVEIVVAGDSEVRNLAYLLRRAADDLENQLFKKNEQPGAIGPSERERIYDALVEKGII